MQTAVESAAKRVPELSSREIRILALVTEDNKYAAIAPKLGISEPAVRVAMSRIYQTLGVKHISSLKEKRRTAIAAYDLAKQPVSPQAEREETEIEGRQNAKHIVSNGHDTAAPAIAPEPVQAECRGHRDGIATSIRLYQPGSIKRIKTLTLDERSDEQISRLQAEGFVIEELIDYFLPDDVSVTRVVLIKR